MQRRRWRDIASIFGFLVVVLVVLWLVWFAADPETDAERISTLQIMATIAVGSAVAVGSYVAWGNLRIGQENLQVSREGQITERFTRAIDQLGATDNEGNARIEIRLGGIYALERIAQDSDRDYQQIILTLTAYLRQNSRWIPNEMKTHEPLREDIAAVVGVIRERRKHYGEGAAFEAFRLSLGRVDLHGANLSRANLSRANLSEADLSAADLDGATLSGATLSGATLSWADLSGATLSRANLGWANLSGAILSGTTLSGADLSGATLSWAELGGATLSGADLSGATLSGAELGGADLRESLGLTVEQLSQANGDATTQHDFVGVELWPASTT